MSFMSPGKASGRSKGGGAGAAREVILLGTVHGDPRGYDRAREFLRALRPRVVAVEISRFSLRYRERHQGRWQELYARGVAALEPEKRWHPGLQRVAAQITMPFEVRAAADYGRETGAAWHPIDGGAVAREHLPRYATELLTPDNLAALAARPEEDGEDWAAAEYHRALGMLADPERFRLWRGREFQGGAAWRRERLLARRLTDLARDGGRVAYLGGWEHLVAGAGLPTLAELLGNGVVQRYLLTQGPQGAKKNARRGLIPENECII